MQLLVAALAMLALAATPEGEAAPRVALVPVVAAGLAADEVVRDESLVRREVDAHYGARSVSGSDVHARIDQAASVGLQCDRAEVSCLVQLGVVCQADVVLLPIVNGATFAFRLVDVGDAQQIAYASTTFTGALRPADVSALLARLEQPDAKKLSLDVTGPPGAKVVVDGAEVARLPLTAPLVDVKPGKHELRVVSDDSFVASVDLRPGEPLVVHAPVKSSFPMPWIIGGSVVASAGAVAIIVGVVPYFQYQSALADLSSLNAKIGSDATRAKQNAAAISAARASLETSKNAWQTSSLPLIVGGAAAITAGVVLVAVPFVVE